MANKDKIGGLTPVSYIDGSPYCGATILCNKAAGTTVTNDLFVGDPVVLTGTGDTVGIPGVTKATLAAGSPIFGVITGLGLDPDNLGRSTWIDGADNGYVAVATGIDIIWEIQADAALAVTSIGLNTLGVQTAAGDRTTGKSGIELDASEVAAGATLMFKVVGFPQRVDNEVNAVNNKVLVVINNSQLYQDNAGV